MAKKPGSWHKLNTLTKSVTVSSRKKGWITAICALLYLGTLIPSTYFAVSFLANILNYRGIETDGPLPDINDGDYFRVNFAKTTLRDNTIATPIFDTYEIPSDPNRGQVAQTRVRARSLRLEYAYNFIFENAPRLYIANNIFFKHKYRDVKQIQITNIYTNSSRTKELGLADIQQNQFNLTKNLLYLKIKYQGVEQNSLIWMPTLFVGNEGFLSNFLSFKLAEIRNKDAVNSVLWDKQTKILGYQANNIMINGSTDSLALDDKVYESYQKYFAAFYAENKGFDKEFIGEDNPYNNFVISSVNPKDEMFPGVRIDSTGYMLDINRVIETAYRKNNLAQKALAKNEIRINGKYIPQLLIFLINILETSQHRGLVLSPDFVPEEWKAWYQLITPKRLNVTQPEQFYLMFLPKGETIQNLINNRLKHQIKDVLSGKYSLEKAIKDLQEDVLSNPNGSKYQWVYNWNILPFQSYGTSEKTDYNVIKRTRQEKDDLSFIFGQNEPSKPGYVVIDQPSLHSVATLSNPGDRDAYTIDDVQKRNDLFTKYWNAHLYGGQKYNKKRNEKFKLLNQIDINLNNLPFDVTGFRTILENEIVHRTWDFIQNFSQFVGENLNIINSVSKPTYGKTLLRDKITFTPLNNYHNSEGNFNVWYEALKNKDEGYYSNLTVIDIKIELQDKENVPDHLQAVTFRFNINYI